MTKYKHIAVAVIWILGIAVAAHLVYSSLGFNPTDDGFTLAYARRLLNGQIPHRDFIIIRPALSPLLHLPEVLLGGQFTYWLSRFIFFLQCACIAWFGTAFINRNLNNPVGLLDQCAFAVISFAICCHSFPVMAWHTIDGLFLCTLAFYINSVSSVNVRPISYVLLGLAYLCKQSFIFVAPATLLILGDWKNWRNLIASMLPGVLYLGILWSTNGIIDGWQQLLSQTGIVQSGIFAYVKPHLFIGILTGIATASLLYNKTQDDCSFHITIIRRITGYILILSIIGLTTYSLFNNNLQTFSFGIFGMVCGVIIYLISNGTPILSSEIQTGMITALLAWSVSLSLGYNTPVLGSGMLTSFLIVLSYKYLPKHKPHWLSVISILTTLLIIVAFHYTRTHHIYRDRHASELTASIADHLPGGRLIRTNPNTYAFLADLNLAITNVVDRGFEYAIVPAVAGHWAKSEQKNPLPIDWAQGTELSTKTLRSREIQSIQNGRDRQMIIVQKVRAASLPNGFALLDENKPYYTIVAYVKNKLEKVDETRFFEIYQ